MIEEILEKFTVLESEDEELIEKLAALEHEQWMQWAKDILKTEDINKERMERWKELFVPYDELTEEMKEEDRKWARKVLSILWSQLLILLLTRLMKKNLRNWK